MKLIPLLLLLLMPSLAQAQNFRVGVWNIEKMSTHAKRGFPELRGTDQLDPRTPEDLEKIAKYLKNDVKADAIMVTEIDDDGDDSTPLKPRSAQLSQVVDKMGNEWKYFLGRTGGNLRIGFVFNTNRIKLKHIVNLDAPEFKVDDEDIYDRDPLIVWISLLENGEVKNDLLLVGIHLKSQQSFLDNHMAAVAKLIGDLKSKTVRSDLGLPAPSDEDDVIVVGDCNDSAHQRTGFKYMFDYFEGVGFSHLGPEDASYPETRVNGSQIDHIFVSNKSLSSGVDESTFKVHLVPQNKRKAYRETFSDHFPVTVDVTAHDDEDG